MGEHAEIDVPATDTVFQVPDHNEMLTSVVLPDWVDDAKTRSRLLNEYNIEVGAGLGWLKGKIWRVGLMGETCKTRYIHCLMGALKEILS